VREKIFCIIDILSSSVSLTSSLGERGFIFISVNEGKKLSMSTDLTIRDQSENPNSEHFSISTNELVPEDKRSVLKDCICMLAAEFIGTFCLMFFGCMGTLDWIQMPGKMNICSDWQ
jgi:hypothetical protein